MKKRIIVLLIICILILVAVFAFFRPKSSRQYPGYIGGNVKECECFGSEKVFAPDGGATIYTCRGIIYNCKTYYQKSSIN